MISVGLEMGGGGGDLPSSLEYLEQSYFELVFDDKQWKKVNLKELKKIQEDRKEIEEIDKLIYDLKGAEGVQEIIVGLKNEREDMKRKFHEKQSKRRQKKRKHPTVKLQEQLDQLRVSVQRFVNPPNYKGKRKVYVGITSGPDIDDAMEGRNDTFKREEGTTRIIGVSVIRRKPTSTKPAEKVLDTIREVNKMFEKELIFVGKVTAAKSSKGKMFNRGKGGEGRPSGQDQHILYFAVAE